MQFKRSLHNVFRDRSIRSLSLVQVCDTINSQHPSDQFSQSEINAAVEQMTRDNQIMVADGLMYII